LIALQLVSRVARPSSAPSRRSYTFSVAVLARIGCQRAQAGVPRSVGTKLVNSS
jgi:hypothetical protein